MMLFLFHKVVFAGPAIVHAKIHKSESTFIRSTKPSKYHRVSWPFYSSYPYDYFANNPHWIELEIDISVYQQRINDPHDSFATIIERSQQDLLPLTEAFEAYFTTEGITSIAEQAGHVLGLIQGIEYAFDSCESGRDCDSSKATGWTDYPKFSIEMIVEQVGDCDDAAISVSSLLTNMNIPTYILLWYTGDNKSAHLSVGSERIQDLANVQLPQNSSFIVHPQNSKKLIHFEATEGLKPLGHNEWGHDPRYVGGLHVRKLASTINSQELLALNLQTWSQIKGERYRERKKEDRRGASREEIEEELQQKNENWEEENTKRLQKLGIDEEEQKEIIQTITTSKQNTNDNIMYGIWVVCTTIIGGLWFRNRQHRLQKIQEAKEKVKNESRETF
jgi:hypothetical protein